MQKKLTVKVDARVHARLSRIVGQRRMSKCLESLAETQVTKRKLDMAYRELAREEKREAEALEWAEATVGDVADETR